MPRLPRKMKFAAPLPDNVPGPDETQERFTDRMAAHGNRNSLDEYYALLHTQLRYDVVRDMMRKLVGL